MSSILTNTSSMAALETLRGINRNLQTVQSEISSGKKVATAKDNAAVWTVAAIMSSDVAGFKTISDSLTVASATVGVARSVAEKIVAVLQDMKTLIVQAQDETVDRQKYQDDLDQKAKLVEGYVSSAQFNGLNLLTGTSSVSVLGSLNRTAGGTVTAAPITVTRPNLLTSDGATAAAQYTAASALKDLGLLRVVAVTAVPAQDTATLWNETAITTGTAAQKAAAALTSIETMLNSAIDAAAGFGSAQNQIESQNEFVKTLVDAMATGIGALTDTDMEAASAKLQALQVQQQLGVQSLSIANQAPQILLSLFRQ